VRTVLRLHEDVAPYRYAVLPLLKKQPMVDKADAIFERLRVSMTGSKHSLAAVDFDATGSVGRRYRRQDEAGTPCCITVDHQTLQDDTVTVRARDSMRQVRISVGELCDKLPGMADVDSSA